MKKYAIIALCLVLTLLLLTGCRSRQDTGSTSDPTVRPTVELPTSTTETPTAGPTEASTAPTMRTEPSTSESGASDATGGSDMSRIRPNGNIRTTR